MSWIYLTEPGARLTERGGCYVISRENETICEIPKEVAEGAVIIDTVQVSSHVVTDFLKRGLPLTWLSSTGKFFGRLETTQNQDVMRQAEQFALQEDDKFRVDLSRRIIFAKVYNQITVLRRYNRSANDPDIDKAIHDIRRTADNLHKAETINSIMGYEGTMARIYFAALGHIMPDEFKFEKRTRQPPTDRFNSMLSFGYTLLMYDFYTAIVNVGLHPYVGFLHSLSNGHPALASDLMEPWRPAIVDSMCLSLVSHHEIRAEQFIQDTENDGVYLDKIGRRIFIKAYEKKMQSLNKYFDGNYSWRHTIEMECRSYSLALDRKNFELMRQLIIR